MDFFKFLWRAAAMCLVLAVAAQALPGMGAAAGAFFLQCTAVAALLCLPVLLWAGLGKVKDALGFFGLWPR
jgi:hypothetical protein